MCRLHYLSSPNSHSVAERPPPRDRRSIGRWIPLLGLLGVAALIPQARAEESAITGLQIVSETTNAIVVDVRYVYLGEHGGKAFASVVMASDGETSPHVAYRPGTVRQGKGVARVELFPNASAPKMFVTEDLAVSLYVKGKQAFLTQTFAFPKTWTQANFVLRPRRTSPLDMKPSAAAQQQKAVAQPAGEPSQPTTQGDVERRVLPDGTIELRLPDGRIVQRTEGRQITIRPDGSSSGVMHVNAPWPTPPSGPSGQTLKNWLLFESEQLMYVMRILVGNDDASIANYLQQEGADASPYEKVESRIEAIQFMTQPAPGY
jgi:hypothetical protein